MPYRDGWISANTNMPHTERHVGLVGLICNVARGRPADMPAVTWIGWLTKSWAWLMSCRAILQFLT
jgi:hypothetical protein